MIGILPDGIDNWIVYSVGFGKDRAPNGEKWTDLCSFKDTGIVDNKIWCPCHEPQ